MFNVQVAPPGRKLLSSKGRPAEVFDVGKSKAFKRQVNLDLKVAAENGQSFSSEPKLLYTASISFTISAWSTRADWWRADLPLVFGSWIRRRMKESPGARSDGSTRSFLEAWSTSPILSTPAQVSPRMAASYGQPQYKAVVIIANKTETGSAGWCSWGSPSNQENARLHACANCLLRIGFIITTAFMVSE